MIPPLADLDPGFTFHAFLANLVLTRFGAAGGFAAAWWIYRKSSQDERERFQRQLEQDRQQFQGTIAHDIAMRREEDENRRKEREGFERSERRRLWIAVLGELHGNLKSIDFMRLNRPSRIPLRRALLDQGIMAVSDLPLPVAEVLLSASLQIDQSGRTGCLQNVYRRNAQPGRLVQAIPLARAHRGSGVSQG